MSTWKRSRRHPGASQLHPWGGGESIFPRRRFEVSGFGDSGFIGIKGFRVEILSALGLEDSGPGGGGVEEGGCLRDLGVGRFGLRHLA